MNLIDEWVELDQPAARRVFLVQNFHCLAADEFTEDVTQHLTYQLKNRANYLLRTDQRRKVSELADSLLYLSLVLPASRPRARNLARARGYMVRGNYFYDQGDYSRAEMDYREAQRLCLECDNALEAIRCQMGLLKMLGYLGRQAEAMSLIELTLQQAEDSGNRRLLVEVVAFVAATYFDYDDYQREEACYRRMLALLHSLAEDGQPDPELEGIAYRGLAENQLNQHHLDEALELAGKSRDIGQQIGQILAVARSERLIANILFYQGHYTRALRTWDNALQLFESQHNYIQAHLVNQARCQCLLQLNQLDKALELCQRLIREASSRDDWANHAAIQIYQQAVIQTQLGDDAAALASYNQAAELFESLNQTSWLGRVRLDQAELLLKLKEYTEARRVLRLAQVEFIRQNATRWLAQARLTQARIAQARGRLAMAELLGQEAQNLAAGYDLPSLSYRIWQFLGEVAEAKGQPEQALAYYSQATRQIERLRGAVTLELRGDFLKDKMLAYEGVIYLSLNQADLEQAYDYIERSRSRALTEMLANRVDLRLKATNPADTAKLERLKHLRLQYAQYYRVLNQPGVSGVMETERRGGASLTTDEPLKTALRECEKQIEELMQQLRLSNAAYAEDFSLLSVGSESPQPYLASDTLVIEYYIARGEVLALTISGREKRLFANLTGQAKLERNLRALSLDFQGMQPERASRFLASTQSLLASLYRGLFGQGLAEYAANFQHLIIVPHGPLHYLPFHALFNPATGRYLLEDFTVSYLPAASQLKFYRQRAEQLRHEAASDSLVLGYTRQGRLPFVKQEAQAVAALLGDQTRLYLEEQAKRAVLEELGLSDNRAYRVIHLATHGQFRTDAPMLSFLELSDGTLLTADLFNLRLNARLVTLSACESGLNQIGGGDELVGLSRACLYAGAASLLISLWQVEDRSTTGLMQAFYQNLAQPGATIGCALREAQLSLLQGRDMADYRHPYFWAAFFLIGETGQL